MILRPKGIPGADRWPHSPFLVYLHREHWGVAEDFIL